MLISNGLPTAQQLMLVGPSIQVQVAPPSSVAQAVSQSGQQPLAAQAILGLIDTGAGISGLDKAIIAALGIQPISLIQIGSASGSNPHAVYAIRFEIPGMVLLDPHMVIECDLASQAQKFLLGRDLLSRMMFSYVGFTGQWFLGA